MTQHAQILIIGAGTAGMTLAAQFAKLDDASQVTIIEPSTKHYYQPLWTLVGAGVFDKSVTERDMAEFIPHSATWIKDKVATFEPDESQVTLSSGKKIQYDVLIVAPGIQLDWDKVKGLKDALGKDGVVSNYEFNECDKTWKYLKDFKGGNAIFTFPKGPFKCAGAPQKIMWLAEDHFTRSGIRDKCTVTYAAACGGMFGIPKYKRALDELVEKRDIKTEFGRNLIEVRAASKEAVFEAVDGGDELVMKYDFLHVTPPQSAPDFIKNSPISNDEGWVDVDKYTTQHVRYENIFALGDASSLPCSRTGAAVRKQAPVTRENVLSFLAGKLPEAKYGGYASCPLVTGYGRVMLAEFGYDGKLMETFPFDQARERFSMWVLKAYGLPDMYWHGMLRGRM